MSAWAGQASMLGLEHPSRRGRVGARGLVTRRKRLEVHEAAAVDHGSPGTAFEMLVLTTGILQLDQRGILELQHREPSRLVVANERCRKRAPGHASRVPGPN